MNPEEEQQFTIALRQWAFELAHQNITYADGIDGIAKDADKIITWLFAPWAEPSK